MNSRALWILLLATGVAGAAEFPVISPIDTTFVVASVTTADVNLMIRATDGVPAYVLQCHSGYFDDVHFSYSGDFECRLGLADGQDTYSTLLTEDIHQGEDWESRGRFFAAELKTPCASVPNFGATRTFELRGLRLTLRVLDPLFGSDGTLKALKLHVSILRDSSARRSIAAIVPLPQNAPAICRISHYFPDPAKFKK